jgi:hypothetical protein
VSEWLRHGIHRAHGLAPVTLAEIKEARINKYEERFEQIMLLNHGLLMHPQIHRMVSFDELRMSRLEMGHLRYGMRGRNFHSAIGSSIKRLTDYLTGGNTEHLVDVANLCEIEWIWPCREGTRYEPHLQIALPLSRDALFDPRGLLRSYQTSGVRNYLPAVAAWCGFEFCSPTVAGAYFRAEDTGGHWSLQKDEDK